MRTKRCPPLPEGVDSTGTVCLIYGFRTPCALPTVSGLFTFGAHDVNDNLEQPRARRVLGGLINEYKPPT
jgi:hypothetical protein